MTTAVEANSPALKANAGKYLAFLLGPESYGLPVLEVREIIRLVPITPVPQMPAHIRGVINLRGKIVPVVDLRVRLGLTVADTSEGACIVVVQVKGPTGNSMYLGLIVDGVEEVLNFVAGDLEAAPDFGMKVESDYLLGMAKAKGRVIALLDIQQVISAETAECLERNLPQP